MEVRNDKFAAFIDYFTTNTYVMVIMSDPTIRKSFCAKLLPFLVSAWTTSSIYL